MPSKPCDENVAILSNRRVNEKYYKLIFRSRKLARGVLPGQFMNVQIEPGGDPFLRRPFSYYRVHGEQIEVLYEILGRGTAILARKPKGAVLRVLGPLGKPFRAKVRGKKRILVAGGVGVPPLVFLAEQNQLDYLLIGSKSKAEKLPPSELSKVKAKVLYSTNDGSYGTKGYVTTVLKKLLEEDQLGGQVYIQTCGPTVMMQAVMDLARARGIAGEASLDKDMACGVGVCLGCTVKTPEGWVPSCTKGPVFSFDEILEA